MRYRPLEEIAEPVGHKKISFSTLMSWQVKSILLVSSIYDSFTFEEDGNLTEMLTSEYFELNLTYTPIIHRVSTAQQAINRIKAIPPDLVISMPRVGDMDVFEFGREVKQIQPDLTVILLAYDTRELAYLKSRHLETDIDRIFVWQGDARLFLTIIKLVEDYRNAEFDAISAGVKVILLIEDSIRFYSAYLPTLYTEIVEQTQVLMTDGANRMQKMKRMRARPKIILATTYEEGVRLWHQFGNNVLGIITDARFPKSGQVTADAGMQFALMARSADPRIPILMQSTEAANKPIAHDAGIAFINKSSPTLLRKLRDFLRGYLGFGEFHFRHPDGTIISSAHSLRELAKLLNTIPDESVALHARRNDFSTWLMARTEFDLAKAIRPIHSDEFASVDELRQYLLSAIDIYRHQVRAGIVEEFSRDSFEIDSGITRFGKGSLGGKGRGLAFINSLLDSYKIENKIPGVRIHVPPSAVVATGVFEEFIERNNLLALALSDTEDKVIREAFLAASLPEQIIEELSVFLENTTHPLAVRSSSLLEDSSHQPFAGIYDTFMLPNDDPDLSTRLNQLCTAIRLIYASTFYSDSKSYISSTPNRLEEERMAVIIQKIVGNKYDNYIYPHFAGVARSHDYYPIEEMKAEDGVASIALGLGRTVVDGGRAVRFSPVFPRKLYQFSSPADYLKNAQREFYALDLSAPWPGEPDPQTGSVDYDNNIVQLDLAQAHEHETLTYLGSVYSQENDTITEGVYRPGVKLVTFAGILSGDYFPLAEALKFLLAVGKSGFSCNIEIEFAVKLAPPSEGPHELAFLQIRPLVFGTTQDECDLSRINPDRVVCSCARALGHGRMENIRDLIYVDPEKFDRSKTVAIASEIGAYNAQLTQAGRPYILIGPGRWGSADHWLGIPVTWGQISGVGCIVETEMADMVVAPSQGTHFFQNITSFGIGYFTVNSISEPQSLNTDWLANQNATTETKYIKHVTLETPLEVIIDGRSGKGIVLHPDH